LNFAIEIDGGAGPNNIAEIAAAGVDWVVAGSSVFGAPDAREAARQMQRTANEAVSIKV
jgi:ribulose-phosphate 3-epimerase